MAPFRWPDDSTRLDFQLLRHTSVSLYFERDVLGEHIAWLREHQYLVHSFDCSNWSCEDDFHIEFSRVLGLHDYRGRNMNAFNDRLCRLDVSEAGGTAFAFLSFNSFCCKAAEPSWHLLDVIALWSRYFLLTGRRLLALVHSDDRAFHIKPVGAQPVYWNSTERVRHTHEQRRKAGVKTAEDVNVPFP
jgi:hypothetical protein